MCIIDATDKSNLYLELSSVDLDDEWDARAPEGVPAPSLMYLPCVVPPVNSIFNLGRGVCQPVEN